MGSSVSALPQPQGGNWPVLLHADIALTWLARSPGATVQKCALPLFLPNQQRKQTNNILILRILADSLKWQGLLLYNACQKYHKKRKHSVC